MKWKLIITPTAKKHLKAITDQRIQKIIEACISGLVEGPEQQGKLLAGDLAGYRSMRVYRQRYRIIYEVDADQMIVYIHVVGIRKEGDRTDVYALAKRILRLNLLTLSIALLHLLSLRPPGVFV
ncbi:MAG: type II toxin-antitoxin system RelE/ParE family toxin [Ktedonobacteraceae bacterium]|nr:type II toxin-antitoxin system RelE/ParE family toxin [Ktedonobacteraceae bacterium]